MRDSPNAEPGTQLIGLGEPQHAKICGIGQLVGRYTKPMVASLSVVVK